MRATAPATSTAHPPKSADPYVSRRQGPLYADPQCEGLRLERRPDPDAFRRKFAIRQQAFLILSVSRLDPLNRYKGFDRTIEAVMHLKSRRDDFRWVVVGGGADLDFYRDRAHEAGASSHLSFVGAVEDACLADAYAACDIFCLLSREEQSARGLLAEGYGIVFLEAASFSKAAVGLRRGGVPDAVIHEQTGILVDVDDAEAIADEISRLIDDPDERKRLSHNAYERAMGVVSWSAARQRLREMLATLDAR